jgi:hypothetical protein
VWTVATIIGIVAPVFVSGSDPTRIPVAALVAPVAAATLTTFAGVITNRFQRRAPSDSAPRWAASSLKSVPGGGCGGAGRIAAGRSSSVRASASDEACRKRVRVDERMGLKDVEGGAAARG